MRSKWRTSTSRLGAALAALILGLGLAGDASAQLPGAGPAPAVEPGTRLAFPPSLGGAQLESSASLGASGVTYAYGTNKMNIFVHIFNGGRRVPTGSDTPQLTTQFKIRLDDAESKIKNLGYSQLDRPTVASSSVYANVSFRCLTYSAAGARGRMFSKHMLTGYHDNFLEIRIDWAQIMGQNSTDADAALKAFVPALMHGS
jgi:hypothetical protein